MENTGCIIYWRAKKRVLFYPDTYAHPSDNGAERAAHYLFTHVIINVFTFFSRVNQVTVLKNLQMMRYGGLGGLEFRADISCLVLSERALNIFTRSYSVMSRPLIYF